MSKRSGIILAYPFEEKRLAKWNAPLIIAQPKLDGERARAIISPNGEVQLLSSECNEITSVPHINEQLGLLAQSEDIELDGELYFHDTDFSDIHSIVGRTVNIHSDYERMQYHVFDMVSDHNQVTRLHDLVNLYDPRLPNICLVPAKMIEPTAEAVFEAMNAFTGNGYEGIILRNPYGLYARKRSTDIMKFKPKKRDIYVICGYSPEVSIDGTIKDTILGRFICAGSETEPVWLGLYPPLIAPPKGFFAVSSNRLGTGDKLREQKELWERREELQFKELVVAYQNITPKKVPRHPVFVDVIWS